MNNTAKRVTISKNLLSYTTAMRGSWIFKASVFDEKQILVIGFNNETGEFFTKVFLSYHEVIDFLEFISFRNPKAGFPDL